MNLPVILLVEDDPNDVELTRLALEENHVRNELIVAQDGADALEYVFGTGRHSRRDTSAMPQVILLDLKLPKVTGLEVLRRLRSDPRTKLIPTVIFTSSKEDRDLIESYQLGANAYVRKPIDFAEFSEAVRQLGLFWILLNLSAPPQVNLPAPPQGKRNG